jgi:hypothetical protein
MQDTLFCILYFRDEHILSAMQRTGISEISFAEPHHFYAAPAPGKNFDAAPAAPAPAPTLL